jgi:TatD DNase family protein
VPLFIDSHAHLADPAFDADIQQVIARARFAGVRAIVCIGESLLAAERALAIACENPGFVFHTVGVHPHDCVSYDPSAVSEAIDAHFLRGAVAVGECGLDYHYDHSPRDQQRRVFADQLRIAAERRRPVVVHSRDADSDMEAMVVEAGADGVRGVLHCFTGPPALAERALEAGWYISFSGIVTFKRWTDDALVRMVPEDRLLVESDAPYLAPVPHRGRRNEPAHVRLTLERVASVRGTSAESLGPLTAANAQRLFGLALATDGPVGSSHPPARHHGTG